MRVIMPLDHVKLLVLLVIAQFYGNVIFQSLDQSFILMSVIMKL